METKLFHTFKLISQILMLELNVKIIYTYKGSNVKLFLSVYQVPKQVPEQQCNQVEREECYDVPRQVPREECRDVPRQVERQECKNIPRQTEAEKCVDIPRQQERQQCTDVPRQVEKQDCRQVPSRIIYIGW